ncbi:hypothetical protein DL767_009726 [Monosporascus sp. MG133]|nr:hypothetical protein DL767_009726 [Monosporascus sp. MG133]
MPGIHVDADGNKGDNKKWHEEEDEKDGEVAEGRSESPLSDRGLHMKKLRQDRNNHPHTRIRRTNTAASTTTTPFPDLEFPSALPTPTSDPVAADNSKKPPTESNAHVRKGSHESVRKLSASQMQALTSARDSLPIAVAPPPQPQRKPNGAEYPLSASAVELPSHVHVSMAMQREIGQRAPSRERPQSNDIPDIPLDALRAVADVRRPASIRTLSTPPANRRAAAHGTSKPTMNGTRRNSFNPLGRPPPLNLSHPVASSTRAASKSSAPSKPEQAEATVPATPMIPPIPLPPMSLPTHLQLELAGQRPSPLYIYQTHASDVPYESSAVKFERLLNALLLPPYLEQILVFGTLACFDAWLYTFTILPMRFFIAVGVLVKWWGYVIWKETRWLLGFVWEGIWRLKRRAFQRGKRPSTQTDYSGHTSETETSSRPREVSTASQLHGSALPDGHSDRPAAAHLEHPRSNGHGALHPPKHPMARPLFSRHRRTKSTPSDLTSYHKADFLQGAVIVCSSLALINLDASRMYHFIRAQSSMKLYVIYNILEVGDRLLSALGQDIFECLFSSETLSRNSFGRSKILLPFGMFILSLIYNVIHTLCLFYQVITLNVAVNSYSNSLLTLLISNQFVEIKGAVFKRIEKENLFQLTCADVVERFQLWIILLIIGMRNIVEVGGLSVPGAGSELDNGMSGPGPLHTNSILPASFTALPSWLISGEVLSPFFVVIGIEMMVDWIKHAYINKFNNVKPTIYNRMLDILCKDYYTNAFGTPSLTRRIGLPLIPLSCLFIRASIQIYNMFLATHLPPPIPTSTMELSVESSTPSSPAMIATLERLDMIIRNALGRAVYGDPSDPTQVRSFWAFTSDDAIALLTMLLFFFLAWIVLLIVKLLLGMALLRYARGRYAAMVLREQAVAAGRAERESFAQPGKRVGPYGATEVGDERRRWLYEDDPDGLKRMRDRERKTEERFKDKGDDGLSRVLRYELGVSKRIW